MPSQVPLFETKRWMVFGFILISRIAITTTRCHSKWQKGTSLISTDGTRKVWHGFPHNVAEMTGRKSNCRQNSRPVPVLFHCKKPPHQANRVPPHPADAHPGISPSETFLQLVQGKRLSLSALVTPLPFANDALMPCGGIGFLPGMANRIP